MHILYFLMALAGGAGLSIQAAVNSRLSVGVGSQPLVAAMISFAVGTVVLLVVAGFMANWQTVSVNLLQQPWWAWIGGAIGAGFVFTAVFLAPKLGVSNTMFLFILGQLVMGLLIDKYGWLRMPMHTIYWWKYVGLVVMISGVALFVFGDRIFLKR